MADDRERLRTTFDSKAGLYQQARPEYPDQLYDVLDTVVALLPFYAGLRINEVVGLGLGDVALSAPKGSLRIRGKDRDGRKLRELPLTRPELRSALASWLEQRPTWPTASSAAQIR